MSRARRAALFAGPIWLLLASAPCAWAATISILNLDGAGEGFNDTTAVSPVVGNSGTTLGQQRLNVFNAAAGVWAAELKSSVTIEVNAKFDPLFCDGSGAVLGQAGATGSIGNFPNAPLMNVLYHRALGNSLAGSDQSPASKDITATFNSVLDDGDPGCIGGTTFWYGIGGTVPGGTVDLFPVVLHELGHGLGFSTFYDKVSGALAAGFPDTYLVNLKNESTGELFKDMTDGERLTAQVNSGNLTWVGANANSINAAVDAGAKTNNHLRMYAPNPVQQGSSVSHWDTVFAPDEIMEPIATANPKDYATWLLMKDLAWVLVRVFNDGFESGDDDFWSNGLP